MYWRITRVAWLLATAVCESRVELSLASIQSLWNLIALASGSEWGVCVLLLLLLLLSFRSRFRFDGMLEGQTYLISRALPSSCEHESKWFYMTCHLFEITSIKRPLGAEREPKEQGESNNAKRHKLPESPPLPALQEPLLPSDRSNSDHGHGGDGSDCSSFINQIGRDNSISCLARCSRSDYGALACVSKAFRSSSRAAICTGSAAKWISSNTGCSHELLQVYVRVLLAFGERAIVAGGTSDSGSILDSAELYNSETQTWTTLPSMNIARRNCSGVFMDGKFYVIGGIGSNNELLACGEEYDLKEETWTIKPNMSPGLHGPSGAPPLLAVVNNELYAANCAEKTLRKYDKAITLGSLWGDCRRGRIRWTVGGLLFELVAKGF
uniref:F-box/kelch-repeat protein n=1 Tax=Ananas comosus var. bracteatus TaxID=296719 RepID=A0A6V7P6Y7_ANACO|nr:unnamed protein product [Ananas comosus var. bracteatus]